MRRSITAPVRIKTANEFIAMAHVRSKVTGHFVGPHMQTAYVRDTRETIANLLTQISRPRRELPDGTPNRYHVRLTRIAPGFVDSHDNLGASFKAVVDEIAHWLGVDDGRLDRVRWSYEQMGCPLKMAAVRIEVEDLEPGTDIVIERGNLPKHITASRPRGTDQPKPPPRAPDAQQPLVFREVYAVLPWDQEGPDPILTPLAMKGDNPPERIRLRVPAAVFSGAASVRFRPGTEATFVRSLGRVDSAECWIYTTPDGPADSNDNRSRRAP